VSLIGGISGFSIGFIYPPAMYLKVFGKHMGMPVKIINVLIMFIGLVLLVFSTAFATLGFF
jgi:hypothetical protein